MTTKITPEEVTRFVDLYQSGVNTPEIVKITGRSLRAVCYSLRKAGVELRAEQPTQTPKELEDKAVGMYGDGCLRSEIAKALDTDGGTVTRILRRRLGAEPTWNNPERQSKRAKIWGNPDQQPARASAEIEDLILARYRERVTWERIAEEAGVSVKTVANVLARRGIAVSRWFKTTPEQRREIIRLHAEGADSAAISAAIGITEDAVKKFTAYGRESAFSAISSPEAAYWLGFVNADGSILGVNPGTLRLQVTLARKDRPHLVKLSAFLGSAREIYDYEARTIGGVLRPYSRLTCQERPVVMDLVRHGILPNKTGTETPWDGPAELMPHYWRGMVDGDGSVPGKSYTVTLTGSYEVVSAFTAWAAGVSGTMVNATRDNRSPNHWRAIIGGRRSIPPLLYALYHDAPVSLDRKQEMADRTIAAADAAP